MILPREENRVKVLKTGMLVLEYLGDCGYHVRFRRMGCDRDGNYALYSIDVARLPTGVAPKHLRNPKLVKWMKKILERDIVVAKGRGAVDYIVPLRTESEPRPQVF